eukprot:CAMPEP_0116073102 /NCGR_PEP_ID=MMETSP0322-20121206/14997_1 /TAXON_ID=163516 /ORGANISM="Leptocylindrus danicus var. apora, Strain B651" /LENGTH=55 /DNA_ID=CAMNT_0003562221 /DNA_START=301 /DNA_END=465 /DNA_ORIENTATION=-
MLDVNAMLDIVELTVHKKSVLQEKMFLEATELRKVVNVLDVAFVITPKDYVHALP